MTMLPPEQQQNPIDIMVSNKVIIEKDLITSSLDQINVSLYFHTHVCMGTYEVGCPRAGWV